MISNFTNHDRPTTPEKEDCCGNGCSPCIFDVHKKLLDEWNAKKDKKSNSALIKNFLSPVRYRKFIVKDITKASQDCILIQLNCKLENEDEILLLSPSQHVIIKMVSISKPYTPISWTSKSLKLLVKLYPNGKASDFMKKLQIDDVVFIRGTFGEFKYKRNSFKQILMLSVGSGIAALYPLAVSITNDELEETKIDLITGFHSLEHVPLKNELRLLADFWNFQCTLYLSETSSACVTGLQLINSRLNIEILNEILCNYSSDSLILICGTPEFNNTTEKIIKEKNISNYHIFR